LSEEEEEEEKKEEEEKEEEEEKKKKKKKIVASTHSFANRSLCSDLGYVTQDLLSRKQPNCSFLLRTF
jgi:hypothetical protein